MPRWEGFILIFACLLGGALLRRSGRMPEQTPAALGAFIIHLSLPALTFRQAQNLSFGGAGAWEAAAPIAMAWIVFILGAFWCGIGSRVLGLRRAALGALILTSGLGNTSFVGFPMLEALLGPESLSYGILADQPGSFLVLSTLGLATAAAFSPKTSHWKAAVSRVLTFPPLIALLLGLTSRWVGIGGGDGDDWFRPFGIALDRLGGTLVPLALVSVGSQLRFDQRELRSHGRALAWGLSYKLLLAPAAIAWLYRRAIDPSGMSYQVSVLEAAMAPMITAAVVAQEYEVEPRLANLMVAIGVPLSIATVTGWWWWMR